MERARGHRQRRRLLDQRAQDHRVRVPEADRRVRRHHVEVAVAAIVPEPDALALRQDDRQRMIIRRSVDVFQRDERMDGCVHDFLTVFQLSGVLHSGYKLTF